MTTANVCCDLPTKYVQRAFGKWIAHGEESMVPRAFAMFLFVVAMSVGAALAGPLRPLSDVVAQEQSPSMQVYVFKRCSAVWAAMSVRMERSGRRDVADLAQQGIVSAGAFFQAAIRVAQENGLSENEHSVSSDIVDMVALYSKDMQDEYLATGNAFGDLVQGDVKLCKLLQ